MTTAARACDGEPACALRWCIQVSSGITAARNRFRVSLVTVATRSTTSSPYSWR